jgi:hypothetical protein
MWNYLSSLPEILSFSIIIIGLLAIVTISLRGTAVVKWGKNLIGLGNAKLPEEPLENTPKEEILEQTGQHPATVFLRRVKRSCGDCVMILMAQREKYEFNIALTSNRKLKNCMLYAEQKIADMLNILNDTFANALENSRAIRPEEIHSSEDVQYKMFYGLMRDSLVQVKDEIRRSYKENGFYELSEAEFSGYVKDKSRKILSTITTYIRTVYPTSGVSVEGHELLTEIEFNAHKFQELVFDMYRNAKTVITDIDTEVDDLKKKFSDTIDQLVA